jgi:hypothetical protein
MRIRAQSRIQSEVFLVFVNLGLWCELSVSTANEKIPLARELAIGNWEYQSAQAMANQDVKACLSPEHKNYAYIGENRRNGNRELNQTSGREGQ